MEELAFLVAMQRVVGGIQVKHDLLGGLLVGIKKEIDEQLLDCRRVVADLVVAGSARLSSSRFSVDLPASGAQFDRCVASLLASTGSWRRSSWSFRSS
jgi:hypothetical protein